MIFDTVFYEIAAILFVAVGIGAVATYLRQPLIVAFIAVGILVGTTGSTGLPYILLGSVAEHVLREVTGDVLAVRCGPVPFELP